MKETTRRLIITMMILLGLLVVDNLLAAQYKCATDSTLLQWKNDDGSSATAPGDITMVYVFSGNQCYEVYPTNTRTDCYNATVNGSSVSVSGGGTSSTCQGISHLEGYYSVVDCDPDPIPDPKCEPQDYYICVENVRTLTTLPGDPDLCPCVPTEDGRAVCTENDCGKTLEWIDNCGTKKYVVCDPCECIPDTDCRGRCGHPSDGCGGWVSGCPACPPPPPPPKRWPTPVCDDCLFPENVSITSYVNDNLIHIEQFMFYAPQPVRQMILDMYDAADYVIYAGSSDPADTKNRILFLVRGPGIVTVPIPSAGLPIQEYSYLGFRGGYGRLTVWVDNDSFIYVKTTEAVATP